jgi:hypothetical protein
MDGSYPFYRAGLSHARAIDLKYRDLRQRGSFKQKIPDTAVIEFK